MLFRPPSNRVTKVISDEDGGARHRFKTREQKQSRELQPVCWEGLQENSRAASLCG